MRKRSKELLIIYLLGNQLIWQALI